MDAYSKKTSEGVASDEDESDKSFDSDESDESESDEDNESEEVDRDRPKRPASAYFIFMEKFSQAYKEKHPNNRSVCVVGKAGGDRWKSMSDSEKAPYVAMEKQRKIEYLKYWEAHEKKAVSPWEVRTLKHTGISLGLSFPFTKKFFYFGMTNGVNIKHDKNLIEDVEDDNSEDVFCACAKQISIHLNKTFKI